jgi:hypothetical protein
MHRTHACIFARFTRKMQAGIQSTGAWQLGQPYFSFFTIKAQARWLKDHELAHSKGLPACIERMLAYLLASLAKCMAMTGILRMLSMRVKRSAHDMHVEVRGACIVCIPKRKL